MPSPPPDPELVKGVLEAAALGRADRDIAQEFGVTKSTVARWRKKHQREAIDAAAVIRARVAAVAAEEPPESDSEGEGELARSSLLVELRGLMNGLKRLVAQATATGNLTAAQRAGRDMTALANTIARLEKTQKEDEGTLHLSVEELSNARVTFDEKVHALAERPLLCEECGRELSVKWGEGSTSETDPSG